MSYNPDPVDTSAITLNNGIADLIERLARNEHDVWARRRLAEGWTYGKHRDDVRKEHPALVSYDDLPESEKEYDRDAVRQTIKSLLALGYKLERLVPLAGAASAPGHDVAADSRTPLPVISEIPAADLGALLRIWRLRDPQEWSHAPGVFDLLGSRLLKLGEPLLAYDVLTEGRRDFPENMRLQQLQALALARSGAPEQARDQLQHLCQEGMNDEETLGMLARTYKDLALKEADPGMRQELLASAQSKYEQAYRQSGGYWSGINAASLGLLTGRKEHAAALALEVRQIALQAFSVEEKSGGDCYWPLATLGEAALVRGERSEAEEWYTRAAAKAMRRFGDLSSTRRNARLLTDFLEIDRHWIESCLPIPRVAVFTGHMVDRPGRAVPRFPAEMEGAVRDAVHASLKKLEIGFGYSSAACGSDLIFLELLSEIGAETHIVLPCEPSQFLQDSVNLVAGGRWEERFRSALTRAGEVVTVSRERLLADNTGYQYANQVLLGLGLIRAELMDTECALLAVWDGKPAEGPGGVADNLDHWLRLGYKVHWLDMNRIAQNAPPELETTLNGPGLGLAPGPAQESSAASSQIAAIMFADVKGFSKLTEDQTPLFVQHFLEMVGEMTRALTQPPLSKNTWGDGLYIVFRDVGEAGEFALELCDRVRSKGWKDWGLPELSVRIGLHAGPVFHVTDPVTQTPNCIGTHVSQAARIEPVTPPNKVYASRAFAALASAQKASGFICEYAGQTALAKGYGIFPTYVLRRRSRQFAKG